MPLKRVAVNLNNGMYFHIICIDWRELKLLGGKVNNANLKR